MAGLFDKQAELYLDARPNYPEEWFSMLSARTLHHSLAWDVGTGNGQAAVSVSLLHPLSFSHFLHPLLSSCYCFQVDRLWSDPSSHGWLGRSTWSGLCYQRIAILDLMICLLTWTTFSFRDQPINFSSSRDDCHKLEILVRFVEIFSSYIISDRLYKFWGNFCQNFGSWQCHCPQQDLTSFYCCGLVFFDNRSMISCWSWWFLLLVMIRMCLRLIPGILDVLISKIKGPCVLFAE